MRNRILRRRFLSLARLGLLLVLTALALAGAPGRSASTAQARPLPGPAGSRPGAATPAQGGAAGRVATLSPGMPPLSGTAADYDPVHDLLVSFGGLDSNGVAQNGTYISGDGGQTWYAESISNPPPAESNPTMSCAASDGTCILMELVPSSGASPNGAASPSTTSALNVFKLDPSFAASTALNVTNPPPTLKKVMVKQTRKSDGLVIYYVSTVNQAGIDDLNKTDDRFTLVIIYGATSPDPPGFVYDAVTGTDILFGGVSLDGSTYYNETLSVDDYTFTQLIAPGCTSACPNSPSPRDGAGMAFDAATGTVLLFGGYDGTNYLNDTWSFDGHAWTQLHPAVSPPARAYAGIAYDSALGTVVTWGGKNAGGTLSDTWAWNGSNWVAPGNQPATPGQRYGASLAYDGATQTAVLFGGCGPFGCPSNDTWIWNGTTWALLSPTTSPPARADAAMDYDGVTHTLLLFGDYNSSTNTYLDDAWAWDGSTWNAVCGTSSPATSACGPSARSAAAVASDTANSTIVLFGGYDGSAFLNDTWTWNGTAWSNATASPVTSSNTPPARQNASMAYDGATQTVILFGGCTASGCPSNDAWSWDGGAWSQLSANGAAGSPPARQNAGMAYDGATGAAILFGGLSSSGGALADTWSFSGGAWTQLSPATSPPARFHASMTYDAATSAIVLFGGQGSNFAPLNDTWSWGGSTWSPACGAVPCNIILDGGDGPAGGGTMVTIGGLGLSNASAVSFGGTPASSFSVVDDDDIQAVAPAGPASSGNVSIDVTVATSAGTSAITAADKFTYYAPPTVTSVSPTSGGGGTTVTVTGTNFSTALGATSVFFVPSGGSPSPSNAATSVSCSSTTQCTAVAPPGSGAVDVVGSFFGVASNTSSADQFSLGKLGDVNGDGSVTSVDALCVLRMVVSLPGTTACPQPPPGNPIIATGETSGPTSVDALCILRGVAGLPGTSTCPLITAP